MLYRYIERKRGKKRANVKCGAREDRKCIRGCVYIDKLAEYVYIVSMGKTRLLARIERLNMSVFCSLVKKKRRVNCRLFFQFQAVDITELYNIHLDLCIYNETKYLEIKWSIPGNILNCLPFYNITPMFRWNGDFISISIFEIQNWIGLKSRFLKRIKFPRNTWAIAASSIENSRFYITHSLSLSRRSIKRVYTHLSQRITFKLALEKHTSCSQNIRNSFLCICIFFDRTRKIKYIDFSSEQKLCVRARTSSLFFQKILLLTGVCLG